MINKRSTAGSRPRSISAARRRSKLGHPSRCGQTVMFHHSGKSTAAKHPKPSFRDGSMRSLFITPAIGRTRWLTRE